MSRQREINAAVWRAADPAELRHYVGRPLRPVEVALFERHRAALSGRVLEVGVGAGGLTEHLLGVATELVGIDIAPAMVAHCRARFPQATFTVADLDGDGQLAAGAFDAIVAGFNVVDVVDREERGAILAAWHDALAPGGTLIFSTHNLAAAGTIPKPGRILARQPYVVRENLLRRRLRRRNHARLAPLEDHGDGWAVLNDDGEDHALLHFYASREYEQHELRAHGFEPIECLDLAGRVLGPGDDAADSPELHYVSRRAG